MDIYEKYKIHVINGRRYYEYHVDETLPLLDNTIPHYFKYKDIEIYDNRWMFLALKLVQELDQRNPKSDDYLWVFAIVGAKLMSFRRQRRRIIFLLEVFKKCRQNANYGNLIHLSHWIWQR